MVIPSQSYYQNKIDLKRPRQHKKSNCLQINEIEFLFCKILNSFQTDDWITYIKIYWPFVPENIYSCMSTLNLSSLFRLVDIKLYISILVTCHWVTGLRTLTSYMKNKAYMKRASVVVTVAVYFFFKCSKVLPDTLIQIFLF